MNLRNKRLLSFVIAFTFAFSLLASWTSINVRAYSNISIFNDVRVGLVSMANSTLTAVLNGSYTLNGVQYPSGTILTLKASNGLVNVNGKDHSEVHLLPLSSSNLITLTNGDVSYKYQGKFLFKVSSGKVFPINSLDMESYLKGVVGYEMSDYFPLEALKAQAVAARNYALFKLGAESAKGYDFDDTMLYQVYKGYDSKLQKVIRAVDETRFVVLLHNNKLVEALYSAWHGGYSEDAVNVWGNSVVYLKAKADSFESDPWPNGNRIFTNVQVDSTLKSRGWLLSTDTFIRLNLASITRFTSGRVTNIDIVYKDSYGTTKTKSVTRDKTRTFLGLPSNMYSVAYDSVNGIYTFSGKGYGHGLGMSQIGAKNRAASGQTYEQILKFYFDGTYTENLTPKASIGSFAVSSREASVNSSINMTTIGSGGSGQYMYRYEILRNGVQVFNTEFSGVSSLSYTVAQSGSYEIVSYIKDKLSPLNFDDKQSRILNVINANVSMISSISQSTSSLLVGQQASVKAIGNTGTLYKFEILRDNVQMQTTDFSTSNSIAFIPKQSGSYTIKVYSKHLLSTKEYDDTKSATLAVYDAPVINSFILSNAESLLGQQINLSVAAKGGSGSYLYNFVVMKDWKLVSETGYIESSNFSYTPSSAGKYQFYAYLRDSLNNSQNDVKNLEVSVINNPSTLAASIDKSATIVGQPVKLTAIGSGGSCSGYLYKYELLTGGNTVLLKDFGSEASFIHSPTMSGSYLINIYMKDVASVKEYNAVQTVRFEAYNAPQIAPAKPWIAHLYHKWHLGLKHRSNSK